MHNLVYLSAASNLFSNEELIGLLNASRLKNTRLDITGLLLYNEGSVMQILEGEERAIHTLFNTIRRDNRHKGVIKMIDCTIQERSFREWSMGFKQISNEDWSKLGGYLNFENRGEFGRVAGSVNANIVTMIKSFANVNSLDSINFEVQPQ